MKYTFTIDCSSADSTGYYFTKFAKTIKVISTSEDEAKKEARNILGAPPSVFDIWSLKVTGFEPYEENEIIRGLKTYEVGYIESSTGEQVHTFSTLAHSAAEAAQDFINEKEIYFIIVSVEEIPENK